MNSQRVYELAAELDVNKYDLVTTINELDLGITVDNPLSQLSSAEVVAIKSILRPEHDADVVEGLKPQPDEVFRPTLTHPKLGQLDYHENLRAWVASARFGGEDIQLYVDGATDLSQERLAEVARIFDQLSCDELAAFAASELVELHNNSWRQEGDPAIDSQEFARRLKPESIGISEEGSASVYFDDDDLFYGHVIIVALDATLTPYDAQIAG